MNAARQECEPMLEGRVTKIELHVEQLQKDVAEIKGDQKRMAQDFSSFRAEVTREFGAVQTSIETLRTAIEQNKRWMIVAGAGLFATGIGALTSIARAMKWF